MRRNVPAGAAQAPTRTPASRAPFPGVPSSSALQSVPERVERVLDGFLSERRAAGEALAPAFADEIVERLSLLVLGGGKRLRPAFLWCGWRAAGGHGADEAAVFRVGGALELLQGCALVHDDLMDASPSRRGRPAVHIAFRDLYRDWPGGDTAASLGSSAALLVGDLALAWAEDLWEEAELPPDARGRARPLWQAMRTEMVAGQYLELRAQATGGCSPREALRVAHLKAGLYTVQRPLTLGAALGGSCSRVRKGLERAGRCAGLAFQLRDDLLDVFGSPARLGKPVGEDVRQGKPTYLMTVGLDRARLGGHRTAEEVLAGAQGDRALTDEGLRRVRDALGEAGARGHVEDLIGELAGKAARAVADSGMDGAAADDLTALIGGALALDPAAPLRPPPGAPAGREVPE
ncbi:polyprenyl synthetase family protein [Streptomyces sp. NPDC050560]|uniref:polyprenyl synthetase family protein n=1 Tax=Streptomyces sp. NPDC050560 TaxID=3365630 RepID=UPI0037A08E74